MALKIVLAERMKRTVRPSPVRKINSTVQKVATEAHINVSTKANCATEKNTVWMELMNKKLVVC